MNIYERMQTLINVQQILLIKCISLNVNVILVSTFTEDFTQLLSQEEKRMKKKNRKYLPDYIPPCWPFNSNLN